jgi:hypothetical protein
MKGISMPNKHFCQGPTCHERVTQDRFLKSRGVIRGRYAILPRDHQSDYYGRGKFFCSTACEGQWLDENMTAIEMRIPVPFITHRRESQGYAKVKNDESRWGPEYSIQRVDNRTELD